MAQWYILCIHDIVRIVTINNPFSLSGQVALLQSITHFTSGHHRYVLASYPGLPRLLSLLQAIKAWGGLGTRLGMSYMYTIFIWCAL